jgi:hypothetical protein
MYKIVNIRSNLMGCTFPIIAKSLESWRYNLKVFRINYMPLKWCQWPSFLALLRTFDSQGFLELSQHKQSTSPMYNAPLGFICELEA